MKIGLIVECVQEGPETKVLPALGALFRDDLSFEIESLGNKPNVLNRCGRSAKALLDLSKCDRVLVVWDARPPWKEENVEMDPEKEKQKALSSLESSGLANDPRIRLICIVEELEAWLLADGRGITARVNQLRRARPKLKVSITDSKRVETIEWPKSVMQNLFRKYEVRDYNDWLDAGPIANAIPEAKRLLKHSKVFPQYQDALS
ncbi:MAG: hypothetical protein U0984_01240 [Prosthecobacter sp.]|nr:hypothetical protein [Prosthecobacter sp.]